MLRSLVFILVTALFIPSLFFGSQLAAKRATTSFEDLPGLQKRATVVRDKHGVPHVTASSDRDVYFMMGYLQAQDRFFQMDVMRRQGSGTLAELLGAGPNDQILESDVQFRFFGVKRAADRSLSASAPEAVTLIQAYSDGVNAWLDHNSLPPEYLALEITRVPRWKPIDTVTVIKLIQFQLSFDLDDLGRTQALLSYQAAGQAGGFDGARLYFEDIFRVSPFDTAVTISHPMGAAPSSWPESSLPNIHSHTIEQVRNASGLISPETMEAARKFVERCKKNPLLDRTRSGFGSNWWIVAGSKTETGNAMLANDPHLQLGAPALFYESHLTVDTPSSPMNVYGVSFPGVPGVFLGQNERIAWGATTAELDVTDLFTESLVIENGIPVATRYQGRDEPLVVIPEEYKVNQVQTGIADDIIAVSSGDRPSGVFVPPVTRIVPRRNNGPLLQVGSADGIGIQFAGASATRELEGIFALARAHNLRDFKRGLQLLEVGSLNWAYADVNGNIAAFVNGNIPLREDLQAGTVEGLPPYFLRDGTGTARNEWIPRSGSAPGFNYASLPFEEMPQVVNPAQGFLVNANNDPLGITFDNDPLNQTRLGAGIYYISADFSVGLRAAKITSLLTQQLNSNHGCGRISFQEMQIIQSNVQLFDAEVFTPFITAAFDAACSAGAPAELAALASDAAVSEAVGRLSTWDFSTPTGIPEGYDAGDINGIRQQPSEIEVNNSVAATIYTVWRSRILINTIVSTLARIGVENFQPDGGRMLADLRFLLDNFSTNHGVGASGLDFFEIRGVEAAPAVRRDIIILKSLKEALNLVAGEAFAAAFGRSVNQSDYRWGKLHRITFSHPFGSAASQFSIPTADNFTDLSPTLPGLAVNGSFETINIGPFDPLAASSNAFLFSAGAVRRYVGELRRKEIKSVQIIPGGESGVIGSRFYTNQLSLWLTNDYHRVLVTGDEIDRNRYSKTVFKPAN